MKNKKILEYLLNELNLIDVNTISPIEALLKIHKFQKFIKENLEN